MQVRKSRESNIELLRVLSIFLILVVHADFWTLKAPDAVDFDNAFSSSIMRVFFESLSIICVNVFIIISGWYGINASLKKLSNLMFQGFFFLMIPFVIGPYLGYPRLGLGGFVNVFLPGWFLKSYAVLMIVSPILNLFVEKSSEKKLRNVIIAFFLLEFVYGWIATSVPVIASPMPTLYISGMSATSLIGLYILTRYIKIHVYDKQDSIINDRLSSIVTGGGKIWLFLWVMIVVGNTAIWCLSKYYDLKVDGFVFSYTNPIVIIQSFAMFMTFKKLTLQSKFINWIAASALSVYMGHSIFYAIPLREGVSKIYNDYSGITCLLIIFAFLITIFIISIICDQFRKFIWNKIERYIPEYYF